jgi:hypothetical protein
LAGATFKAATDRTDHDGHVGDRRRRELPCLRLLQRLKDPDVNLRAATTFSFNDFISNGGILIAGVLVLWLGTNWPDLLVGFATAIIAIKGGVESCATRAPKPRKAKGGRHERQARTRHSSVVAGPS